MCVESCGHCGVGVDSAEVLVEVEVGSGTVRVTFA
jgi:hypothetical protein